MIGPRLLVLASLVALALLLPAMLPEPAPRSRPPANANPTASTRFVIADARVFDGERTWPRASVRVADGRIEAIGESLPLPAGYARIEGAGRTLLPGLIDAHVHTWGEARREALRFGVTTMLDMFSDHRQIAAARSERESLAPTARADLWSAGTLATAAGGHGTQFGLDVPTLAAPGEAEAWVAARKAEGSDFIKIVREDLHAFTGRAQLPTLDDATAAAVIAAAKRQGLRAVVHASGQEHARASLRDGADGLVHGFEDAPADEAFIALARERDAFVIATLTVVAGMAGETRTLAADARVAPHLAPGQKQTLAASFGFGDPQPRLIEIARENIRRLHAAGVTILAGSDAPNPNTAHGASLHEELDPDDLPLTDFNQPLPMRGKKLDVWEGGIRVPGFANWPNKLAPRTVRAPVHAVDWLPTFAALLGRTLPAEPAHDGVDLLPSLAAGAAVPERDLYWTWSRRTNRWALRHGHWKLVRYGPRAPAAATDWQLFDLAADPREQQNVAAEHPAVLQALHARYLAHRAADAE